MLYAKPKAYVRAGNQAFSYNFGASQQTYLAPKDAGPDVNTHGDVTTVVLPGPTGVVHVAPVLWTPHVTMVTEPACITSLQEKMPNEWLSKTMKEWLA